MSYIMQHVGHYMGSHFSEEWQTLKLTLASLDTVIFSTAVLSVCVCRACGFLLQLKVCIPQLNGQVLYICVLTDCGVPHYSVNSLVNNIKTHKQRSDLSNADTGHVSVQASI